MHLLVLSVSTLDGVVNTGMSIIEARERNEIEQLQLFKPTFSVINTYCITKGIYRKEWVLVKIPVDYVIIQFVSVCYYIRVTKYYSQ